VVRVGGEGRGRERHQRDKLGEVDRSRDEGDGKRWRNQETAVQEENGEWRGELGLNPSRLSPI
jgi:hypothetical protein